MSSCTSTHQPRQRPCGHPPVPASLQSCDLFLAASGDISMSRPQREKSATTLSPRGFRSQKQKPSLAYFLSPALTPQHPAQGWPRSKRSVDRPRSSPRASAVHHSHPIPLPPDFPTLPSPPWSVLSKSRTVCRWISTVLPGLTRGDGCTQHPSGPRHVFRAGHEHGFESPQRGAATCPKGTQHSGGRI